MVEDIYLIKDEIFSSKPLILAIGSKPKDIPKPLSANINHIGNEYEAVILCTQFNFPVFSIKAFDTRNENYLKEVQLLKKNGRTYILEGFTDFPDIEVLEDSVLSWQTMALLGGATLRTAESNDSKDIIVQITKQLKKYPEILIDVINNRHLWPFEFKRIDEFFEAKVLSLMEEVTINRTSLDVIGARKHHHQIECIDLKIHTNEIEIPPAINNMPNTQQANLNFSEMNSQTFSDSVIIDAEVEYNCLDDEQTDGYIAKRNREIIATPIPSCDYYELLRSSFCSRFSHSDRVNEVFSIILTIFEDYEEGQAMVKIRSDKNAGGGTRCRTCVLELGQPGENSEKSAPAVREWKAAAECFGVHASSKSNGDFFVYATRYTQRIIRQSLNRVLKCIDAWPIVAHKPLIPQARYNALLCAYGADHVLTQEAKLLMEVRDMVDSSMEEIHSDSSEHSLVGIINEGVKEEASTVYQKETGVVIREISGNTMALTVNELVEDDFSNTEDAFLRARKAEADHLKAEIARHALEMKSAQDKLMAVEKVIEATENYYKAVKS